MSREIEMIDTLNREKLLKIKIFIKKIKKYLLI